MAAVGAVPLPDTTLSIIRRIDCAVCVLITLSLARELAGVKCPLESRVPEITVGDTRIPLFAIVAKILVACIAVSE